MVPVKKPGEARSSKELPEPDTPRLTGQRPQLTAVSPSLSLLAEMSALRFSALKSPRWKSPMSGNCPFLLVPRGPLRGPSSRARGTEFSQPHNFGGHPISDQEMEKQSKEDETDRFP